MQYGCLSTLTLSILTLSRITLSKVSFTDHLGNDFLNHSNTFEQTFDFDTFNFYTFKNHTFESVRVKQRYFKDIQMIYGLIRWFLQDYSTHTKNERKRILARIHKK